MSHSTVCQGLSEPSVVVQLDEPWAQRDLQICARKGAVLPGLAAALVAHLRQGEEAE